MISHISIKDFAIIDKIDVDFYPGLNIITGETGAGKSIIIEAISLALGSRADTAFVRSGKDKAIIQLVADLDGEDIIITREVSSSGKSLCKINDEIVTLSHLNKLCKRIADIHGQYDNQSLLYPENHIKLVDSYNKTTINPKKEQVSQLFSKYQDVKAELAALIKNQAEAERKRDFMKFELQEISSANPAIGEDKELESTLSVLQNSETIFNNLSNAYDILSSDDISTEVILGRALHLVQELSGYSDELKAIGEDLSDAYYRLTDISQTIRKYKDSISFSPELLEETINRQNTIDSLKRKYGGSLDQVLEYKDKIAIEIDKLEDIDQRKSKLTQVLSISEGQLKEACTQLSEIRKQTAKSIEKKVNKELQELNFKNAELIINFADQSNHETAAYTSEGIDKVEFLITTNKGEVPKPLVKIASGGEISRIMLAFKQITGSLDTIPTMIFDEIDNGISGITASIVGNKLLDISNRHQIICITHLPQIAAFGDHHYRIEKMTIDGKTNTRIVPLSHEEKVSEIARLLGGINITETTLKSAEELIELSKSGQ